jgi:hypothetical protein
VEREARPTTLRIPNVVCEGSSLTPGRAGGRGVAMSGVILTPDQRLRVFVSSTMEELAEERRAVRRAVERLQLAPVMFELGARPHPPRSLYLAYLRQSHVFVGVYWQRYGWVAPGMDVSGLEDELRHASGIPRLVYLKVPAPDRDSRLTAMIDAVRVAGDVSYQSIRTADELGHLLAADLAVLVSERFLAEPAEPGGAAQRGSWTLPMPVSDFVGRGEQLDQLAELLTRPELRLVTLSGPGGVGKTRLALEAGRRVASRFADGVGFVPLAPSASGLVAMIASALRLPRVSAEPGRAVGGSGAARQGRAADPRQLRVGHRPRHSDRPTAGVRTSPPAPGDQPRGPAHTRRARPRRCAADRA